MKYLTCLFGLLFLANAQMASANTNELLCDCSFSADVDYLYWKTCRSELDQSAEDSEVKFTEPGYDHGFRLGGMMHCNCWDLGVRWTSYCNDSDKYEIDYDVVDIEVGYKVCCDCTDLMFRSFVGAKLAWIDEDFDKNNDGKGKLEFNGYGLYLGSEAKLNLCQVCDRTLSLLARGSFGILDGEFKVKRDGNDDKKEECLYVPVVDAFVGLEIPLCSFCDIDSNVLVGYEVQSWSWREYANSDDLASLGFGGLVVRLNAAF